MGKERPIIDLRVYKTEFESVDVGRNSVIIYVLKGKGTLYLNESLYKLQEESVVIINNDEYFKMSTIEGAIVLAFVIDHIKFNRLINNKPYEFICHSEIEDGENYHILRNKLKKILNMTMDTGDYKHIYLNQAYYDVLIFIINNFCNKMIGSDRVKESRLSSILNYIEDNYNEPLQLTHLAETFFLTPEYFAKYFKQSTGITFLKYLNEVRLRHALEDLSHTDHTLLKISVDSGFPNVAAFNKCFKEKYGMSPSAYRKEYKVQDKEILQNEILETLGSVYLEEEKEKQSIYIEADASHEIILQEYWKEMIGIGSIEILSDSNVQAQIREIRQQLSFKYLKIVFDSKKYIKENNIYDIEKSFDFLVMQGFKLCIAFEFRIIEDREAFLQYIRKIITRCANRYSINAVRKWRFELFYDSDFEADKGDKYFELFKPMSEILKEFEIETDLMGPGLLLNVEGRNLQSYLEKYKAYQIHSSILTLSSMPCVLGKKEENIFINRLTDRYYIRNQIELAHKIMKQEKVQFNKIMISKWIDSLARNNIMNDSCYQAANIMNNILDCYDSVDSICYYQSLDVLCDYNHSNQTLSGLPGLISKDGIKKPSYYAYRFLNHIIHKYIYKDAHCIIGVNDMKNYQIVCHNYKKLNYKYFSEDEHNLKAEAINEYYDDKDKLVLNFKLNHLRNGEYLIKYRNINQQVGSIQDKMIGIKEADVELGPSEIEYLKQISIPDIKLEKKQVEEGILELSYTLEPNEIAYIHIIYKY